MKMSDQDKIEEWMGMTNATLRKELKVKGLPVGGCKADLVKRLTEAEQEKPNVEDSYENHSSDIGSDSEMDSENDDVTSLPDLSGTQNPGETGEDLLCELGSSVFENSDIASNNPSESMSNYSHLYTSPVVNMDNAQEDLPVTNNPTKSASNEEDSSMVIEFVTESSDTNPSLGLGDHEQPNLNSYKASEHPVIMDFADSGPNDHANDAPTIPLFGDYVTIKPEPMNDDQYNVGETGLRIVGVASGETVTDMFEKSESFSNIPTGFGILNCAEFYGSKGISDASETVTSTMMTDRFSSIEPCYGNVLHIAPEDSLSDDLFQSQLPVMVQNPSSLKELAKTCMEKNMSFILMKGRTKARGENTASEDRTPGVLSIREKSELVHCHLPAHIQQKIAVSEIETWMKTDQNNPELNDLFIKPTLDLIVLHMARTKQKFYSYYQKIVLNKQRIDFNHPALEWWKRNPDGKEIYVLRNGKQNSWKKKESTLLRKVEQTVADKVKNVSTNKDSSEFECRNGAETTCQYSGNNKVKKQEKTYKPDMEESDSNQAKNKVLNKQSTTNPKVSGKRNDINISVDAKNLVKKMSDYPGSFLVSKKLKARTLKVTMEVYEKLSDKRKRVKLVQVLNDEEKAVLLYYHLPRQVKEKMTVVDVYVKLKLGQEWLQKAMKVLKTFLFKCLSLDVSVSEYYNIMVEKKTAVPEEHPVCYWWLKTYDKSFRSEKKQLDHKKFIFEVLKLKSGRDPQKSTGSTLTKNKSMSVLENVLLEKSKLKVSTSVEAIATVTTQPDFKHCEEYITENIVHEDLPIPPYRLYRWMVENFTINKGMRVLFISQLSSREVLSPVLVECANKASKFCINNCLENNNGIALLQFATNRDCVTAKKELSESLKAVVTIPSKLQREANYKILPYKLVEDEPDQRITVIEAPIDKAESDIFQLYPNAQTVSRNSLWAQTNWKKEHLYIPDDFLNLFLVEFETVNAATIAIQRKNYDHNGKMIAATRLLDFRTKYTHDYWEHVIATKATQIKGIRADRMMLTDHCRTKKCNEVQKALETLEGIITTGGKMKKNILKAREVSLREMVRAVNVLITTINIDTNRRCKQGLIFPEAEDLMSAYTWKMHRLRQLKKTLTLSSTDLQPNKEQSGGVLHTRLMCKVTAVCNDNKVQMSCQNSTKKLLNNADPGNMNSMEINLAGTETKQNEAMDKYVCDQVSSTQKMDKRNVTTSPNFEYAQHHGISSRNFEQIKEKPCIGQQKSDCIKTMIIIEPVDSDKPDKTGVMNPSSCSASFTPTNAGDSEDDCTLKTFNAILGKSASQTSSGSQGYGNVEPIGKNPGNKESSINKGYMSKSKKKPTFVISDSKKRLQPVFPVYKTAMEETVHDGKPKPMEPLLQRKVVHSEKVLTTIQCTSTTPTIPLSNISQKSSKLVEVHAPTVAVSYVKNQNQIAKNAACNVRTPSITKKQNKNPVMDTPVRDRNESLFIGEKDLFESLMLKTNNPTNVSTSEAAKVKSKPSASFQPLIKLSTQCKIKSKNLPTKEIKQEPVTLPDSDQVTQPKFTGCLTEVKIEVENNDLINDLEQNLEKMRKKTMSESEEEEELINTNEYPAKMTKKRPHEVVEEVRKMATNRGKRYRYEDLDAPSKAPSQDTGTWDNIINMYVGEEQTLLNNTDEKTGQEDWNFESDFAYTHIPPAQTIYTELYISGYHPKVSNLRQKLKKLLKRSYNLWIKDMVDGGYTFARYHTPELCQKDYEASKGATLDGVPLIIRYRVKHYHDPSSHNEGVSEEASVSSHPIKQDGKESTNVCKSNSDIFEGMDIGTVENSEEIIASYRSKDETTSKLSSKDETAEKLKQIQMKVEAVKIKRIQQQKEQEKAAKQEKRRKQLEAAILENAEKIKLVNAMLTAARQQNAKAVQGQVGTKVQTEEKSSKGKEAAELSEQVGKKEQIVEEPSKGKVISQLSEQVGKKEQIVEEHSKGKDTELSTPLSKVCLKRADGIISNVSSSSETCVAKVDKNDVTNSGSSISKNNSDNTETLEIDVKDIKKEVELEEGELEESDEETHPECEKEIASSSLHQPSVSSVSAGRVKNTSLYSIDKEYNSKTKKQRKREQTNFINEVIDLTGEESLSTFQKWKKYLKHGIASSPNNDEVENILRQQGLKPLKYRKLLRQFQKRRERPASADTTEENWDEIRPDPKEGKYERTNKRSLSNESEQRNVPKTTDGSSPTDNRTEKSQKTSRISSAEYKERQIQKMKKGTSEMYSSQRNELYNVNEKVFPESKIHDTKYISESKTLTVKKQDSITSKTHCDDIISRDPRLNKVFSSSVSQSVPSSNNMKGSLINSSSVAHDKRIIEEQGDHRIVVKKKRRFTEEAGYSSDIGTLGLEMHSNNTREEKADSNADVAAILKGLQETLGSKLQELQEVDTSGMFEGSKLHSFVESIGNIQKKFACENIDNSGYTHNVGNVVPMERTLNWEHQFENYSIQRESPRQTNVLFHNQSLETPNQSNALLHGLTGDIPNQQYYPFLRDKMPDNNVAFIHHQQSSQYTVDTAEQIIHPSQFHQQHLDPMIYDQSPEVVHYNHGISTPGGHHPNVMPSVSMSHSFEENSLTNPAFIPSPQSNNMFQQMNYKPGVKDLQTCLNILRGSM